MEHLKQEKTNFPSHSISSNGTPPTYLTSTTVCMKQLPLAIAISCLSILILSLILFHSATLVFQTETSHLLSLILGLFFMLSCTAAIWKHTIKY